MEVDFSLDPSVPVKTDSVAEITAVSPLSDNFLGIIAGSAGAARASRLHLAIEAIHEFCRHRLHGGAA